MTNILKCRSIFSVGKEEGQMVVWEDKCRNNNGSGGGSRNNVQKDGEGGCTER